MGIQILNGKWRRQEHRIGQYMQTVREITQAGLSRRELLKQGLVLGGAGLVAAQGFRSFRVRSAQADNNAGIELISPPNTPFQDPLPLPTVLQPTTLNPAPSFGPNPLPSALTGFTETARPAHQRWTQFDGASETDPGFTGTMYETLEQAALHDFYPAEDRVPASTIWTYFDAVTNAAGPLWIQARYGEPIVFRVQNALPQENDGFGINQTTTHLHGGHIASESDGGPLQFYEAGQFKDFHYPNARAGFSSTNPTSTLNGLTVIGDVRETQSFLWYHDHRVDFTAQNVYKGLASFYTLFSDDIDLDTGDETTGLRLPSGEFDIPMVFADKVFDPTTGQLFFDPFNLDGFLGDKYTVNGKIQPFLEVRRRKYRFRLLDGGPSRVYEFFLSTGQHFFQLTNDGNLLPHTLDRPSIRLGVAERVDVIVDFSHAKIGDTLYLQNRLEQDTGRGPTGKLIAPTNLLQFRVVGDATDASQIPGPLLPLPELRPIVKERQWKFDRSDGSWTVNGNLFDPNVISAFPKQNTAELWRLDSGGGWQHPIHIHLEEFLIQARDKRVPVDEQARKDTVRIGEAALGTDNADAKVFLQFRDWLGDYPMHCHNTVHEDNAMMIRFNVVE